MQCGWASVGGTETVCRIPTMAAGFGDFSTFWEYAPNTTAVSIVYGWLCNTTDTVSPAVMITHASTVCRYLFHQCACCSNTVSQDTLTYSLCALLFRVAIRLRDLSGPYRYGSVGGAPDSDRHPTSSVGLPTDCLRPDA